ncbi:MAG: hypothetical protein HRT61_06580 [Ekhidna sp.]|nr:hypothetical protein [Ekhidna sp.]
MSDSVNSILVDGEVWGVFPLPGANALLLEVRKQNLKSVSIFLLDAKRLVSKMLPIKLNWWDRVLGSNSTHCFYVEYLDQKDPNSKAYYSVDLNTGDSEQIASTPEFPDAGIHPLVYDVESQHHKTVSEFLSLELPLPCEYLEWGNKIILSYYLRSNNGYDRYLLFLEGGNKKWKVQQDLLMKGFSYGAFFVVDDQLIFVKNKNEVCISSI